MIEERTITTLVLLVDAEGDTVSGVLHRAKVCRCDDCDVCERCAGIEGGACYRLLCGTGEGREFYVVDVSDAEAVAGVIAGRCRYCKRCLERP